FCMPIQPAKIRVHDRMESNTNLMLAYQPNGVVQGFKPHRFNAQFYHASLRSQACSSAAIDLWTIVFECKSSKCFYDARDTRDAEEEAVRLPKKQPGGSAFRISSPKRNDACASEQLKSISQLSSQEKNNSDKLSYKRNCIIQSGNSRSEVIVIIIIDSMTSVFNTDALLPYNRDLFKSLIANKRIKMDGERTCAVSIPLNSFNSRLYSGDMLAQMSYTTYEVAENSSTTHGRFHPCGSSAGFSTHNTNQLHEMANKSRSDYLTCTQRLKEWMHISKRRGKRDFRTKSPPISPWKLYFRRTFPRVRHLSLSEHKIAVTGARFCSFIDQFIQTLVVAVGVVIVALTEDNVLNDQTDISVSEVIHVQLTRRPNECWLIKTSTGATVPAEHLSSLRLCPPASNIVNDHMTIYGSLTKSAPFLRVIRVFSKICIVVARIIRNSFFCTVIHVLQTTLAGKLFWRLLSYS
ncbi:hypothetical protein CLF_103207, partial [Clonorchis sinensis]